MLSVDVTLTRGELRLAAAFSLVRHAVLQGANGAGKSTLFRAILGIEPCVGRLTLNGRELGGLPPEDRRIGWVPQGAALFPHLSALGNVAFASGDPTSALAALEQVGAAHLAERSAKVLSGGERQRVALARALATKPEALLLDEPLSALDPVARVALRALLATLLPALGVPSLVITHDAADIAAICGTEIAGRVLTMSAGTLREE